MVGTTSRMGFMLRWIAATVIGALVGLLLALVVIPVLISVVFWHVPFETVWAQGEQIAIFIGVPLTTWFAIPAENLWYNPATHYAIWPYFGLLVGLCSGLAQSIALKIKHWNVWAFFSGIGAWLGLLVFLPLQFAILPTLITLYQQDPAEFFGQYNVFRFIYTLIRVLLLGLSAGLIFAVAQILGRAIRGLRFKWLSTCALGWTSGGFTLFTLYWVWPPMDEQTGGIIFSRAVVYFLAGVAVFAAITGVTLLKVTHLPGESVTSTETA